MASGKQGTSRQILSACLTYTTSSVLLSLTNKQLFSAGSAFDFPLSVLASQAAGTVLLLRLGAASRVSSPVALDTQLLRLLMPVTLLFATMLWTSSRALHYCSVPVVTVFKNLAVVCVCAYEHVVYAEPVPPLLLAALVCMLAGSAIAALGDLALDLVALRWLLLNVLCTVLHVAAIKAITGATRASSASKTFHNQLLALAIFLAAAWARGELPAFSGRLLAQSRTFQLGFALSIVLGLTINYASFWCLSVTSGTTYSFVGASNKIPTALLGHLLFNSQLTALGWAGVAFGLVAGLLYSVAKPEPRPPSEPGEPPERQAMIAELEEAPPANGEARRLHAV